MSEFMGDYFGVETLWGFGRGGKFFAVIGRPSIRIGNEKMFFGRKWHFLLIRLPDLVQFWARLSHSSWEIYGSQVLQSCKLGWTAGENFTYKYSIRDIFLFWVFPL